MPNCASASGWCPSLLHLREDDLSRRLQLRLKIGSAQKPKIAAERNNMFAFKAPLPRVARLRAPYFDQVFGEGHRAAFRFGDHFLGDENHIAVGEGQFRPFAGRRDQDRQLPSLAIEGSPGGTMIDNREEMHVTQSPNRRSR